MSKIILRFSQKSHNFRYFLFLKNSKIAEGLAIVVCEQSHHLQMFNKSGKNYFSSFLDINSITDLDNFLRTDLVQTYYSAEEMFMTGKLLIYID